MDRAGDVTSFYGYASASGHTGFEALRTSELYFYRDITTGSLALLTEHGIDLDASGMQQPPSHVTQQFRGLPSSVTVGLADDKPSELFADSATSITGDWTFDGNSDGGALVGFPLPGSWSVEVVPEFTSGIDTWRYIDAATHPPETTDIPLAIAATATLTAFDTPSKCRLDCSRPRCGDGRLDGGEICDDGNTVSGDGCSFDCTELQ